MTIWAVPFQYSVLAQIPPPEGTEEVRYNGEPRVGEYPLFLFRGTTEFVDFDGDTYMDLVMTGLRNPPEFVGSNASGVTGIYTHRVRHQLTLEGIIDTLRFYDQNDVPGLAGVYNNAIAVGDPNNDGRPDVALSGRLRTEDDESAAYLVWQVDSLVFQTVNPGWLPTSGGSMGWGDYDNDGLVDILITGRSRLGAATRLYQNQGGGIFQSVDAGLPDVEFGAAAWGDSDNDGDLDILISGAQPGGAFSSAVYLNDGGQFQLSDVELPGLAFGHARWIDFNGDGLLDILLAGAELSPLILQGAFYVYLNQGGNAFQAHPVDVPAHFDGDFDLIDWNTDGDLDILASGFTRPLGSRTARLYENVGDEFQVGYTFLHVIDLDFATGDYDRDHDMDLFITGHNQEPFTLVPPVAIFLETQAPFQNQPPSTPHGLAASATTSRVDLFWAHSTDDVTPNPSLTYNLRVGTTPGGVDVVAPLADPATGKPLVCGQGNVFHNTSWHLTGLQPGTYYWSVQAVDWNCAGSAFATEATFTIEGDVTSTETPTTPGHAELFAAFPNPFNDQTAIRFSVPTPTRAALRIYDLLGRRVRSLVDGGISAGSHVVTWNGNDDHGAQVSPGLYIYRLETDVSVRSGTVVFVR